MTILSKIFSPNQNMSGKSSRTRQSGSRSSALHTERENNSAKPKNQNLILGFLGIFANIAEGMQKYQDIPLRFHRQWLATFLASLILVGVVSAIYLNVTSRTAIAGREIQNMEAEIIAIQQKNADLQTNIAGTLSTISLEERAAAAGFVLVAREDIKYLVVPGYTPTQKSAPLPVASSSADSQELPAEYTETLITWLTRQLEFASKPLPRIK